ncbi:MAG: Uncharacterised protein [Polaribacter sp. SA4-10]|nr:MAG: Uncharacterised protein [Polaribacter sp. SA4-10]
MIHRIERTDLDVEKYDACIAISAQSNLFGFSWYLDICCTNWIVLVLNDYEAVMPIPYRKKYGIKYVYTPLWILELGLYSKGEKVQIDSFLEVLKAHFKFAELRLNTGNYVEKNKNKTQINSLQFLFLKEGYESILKKYNRNRKRELIKAKNANLNENWTDAPEKLVSLFKGNIALRLAKINEKDFENLLRLIKFCLANKTGELLTVYSENKVLVSAAFFIKFNNKVTQLVCASDINNRDNGANTFSNDRAIFRYQNQFDIYNFGGSSMESIANYYKSFGAETETYRLLKHNNLFPLLKLFKR